MKKIRVIHCLGQLNTGGAETLTINILRNINREEYQFDFLLFNDNPGFYDEEVKQLGSQLYYISSMSQGMNSYIQNLISFFKKEDIDVVHSHMDWQGGFIAYAAHKAGIKKIVVHSHANQKMFDTDIKHHLLISLSKILIYKYATHCLACSKESGESLFTKDFEVIVNGIDMNRYINPDISMINKLRHEFDLKETDIVLGHVGSFSTNKNQSFIIDVLDDLVKENHNYKLILVGSGSTLQDIKDKVMKLNLSNNVIFAGVRKEVPEIMHLFDMFLFPSIYEGLGIVAVEAQSCGVNCVISITIPKEVDIGIGLVEFVELDNEKWVQQIKNKKSVNVCFDELMNIHYNINNTIQRLEDIYN